MLTQVNEPQSLQLLTPLPLTQHPAMVYLNGLSQGSRSTMTQSLSAIASLLTQGDCDVYSLDWAKLRYQHTAAIQAHLKDNYAPATAKKMICALRRVLEEAHKLGLMGFEDYRRAIDLPKIKEVSPLRGRALSQDEITTLLRSCVGEESAMGARDGALIALLRGTGLRRQEVVKVKLGDYKETGELRVREGKGKKERMVYVPVGAMGYLEGWLAYRGKRAGFLLNPINKGGVIQYRGLTAQAVLFILQKRAELCGLESFSPHDFRRTFGSDLLDAGVDIVTVQKLMGHGSVVTTAKYDRRGEEVKRRAVQKLGF